MGLDVDPTLFLCVTAVLVGKFREVYNYAFGFACDKGQKSLALDTAEAMWRLLFEGRPWEHVDLWCEFLREHHNKVRCSTPALCKFSLRALGPKGVDRRPAFERI